MILEDGWINRRLPNTPLLAAGMNTHFGCPLATLLATAGEDAGW
jgi:hypothetical protein